MAPKTIKNTGTEVDATIDPVANFAKDVNFWRFMVRYAKEVDTVVNVGAIKKIGGLPHTTAYRKLAEAKKLEGIDDDTAGTAAKAADAPKKASKRKLAADDEDVNDDEEPKPKQGKKSANSDVKSGPKKRGPRKPKEDSKVDNNAGAPDEAIEDIKENVKPTNKAKKTSRAPKGPKKPKVILGTRGKIILAQEQKRAESAALFGDEEEDDSDGAFGAVMCGKESESKTQGVEEEIIDSIEESEGEVGGGGAEGAVPEEDEELV